MGPKGPVHITPLQLSWDPTRTQMCALDRIVFEWFAPTIPIFVKRNATILTTALQHLPLSLEAESGIPMEDRWPWGLGAVVDCESAFKRPQCMGDNLVKGPGSRTLDPSDRKTGKELSRNLNFIKGSGGITSSLLPSTPKELSQINRNNTRTATEKSRTIHKNL